MTTIAEAKAGFERRALIGIHEDLGRMTDEGAVAVKVRRGRRYRESALNHAVVVLTVAAWQAFAEDLVDGILVAIMPPAGAPGIEAHKVLKALVTNSKNKYATANAENTRSLMLHAGFDPYPHWQWDGRWPMTNIDVAHRINHWLKVRHAIAHGDETLPLLDVLDLSGAKPSLTKACANTCLKFFSKVVSQTADAANSECN